MLSKKAKIQCLPGKENQMKKLFLLIAVLALVFAGACTASPAAPGADATQSVDTEQSATEPQEAEDNTYTKRDGVDVIYLAGGCFWGTEKLMQSIPGVIAATSGYANGEDGTVPTYETVRSTGHKETVRVEYKPSEVSLDAILFAYFRSVDPKATNRQGNDSGTQYQAGVYWSDDIAKQTVLRVADVERLRFDGFAVEIAPLRNFYDAEEYHQDYLDKHPSGYCHISLEEFELVAHMIIDPADYPRPPEEEIRTTLSELQYSVTQEAATEPSFENEYWNYHERGIYVDVVTGEPLFSSSDKFDSGTGWPSFTKGIDENALILLPDDSGGQSRTEVLSRTGNTHLGHVFYGPDESSSGVRFCINSASLRFVLFDEMEAQGYGYLKSFVL